MGIESLKRIYEIPDRKESPFILRIPDPDLAEDLKQKFKQNGEEEFGTDETWFQLFCIDRDLCHYGLILDEKMHHWTLCDLPNITEAFSFGEQDKLYKTDDIAQVMYVHNETFTFPPEVLKYTIQQVVIYLERVQKEGKLEFDPLKNEEFKAELAEEMNEPEEIYKSKFLLKHGLTPPTEDSYFDTRPDYSVIDHMDARKVYNHLDRDCQIDWTENVQYTIFEFDSQGFKTNQEFIHHDRLEKIDRDTPVCFDFKGHRADEEFYNQEYEKFYQQFEKKGKKGPKK